jgi:chromosome segregation ATPase
VSSLGFASGVGFVLLLHVDLVYNHAHKGRSGPLAARKGDMSKDLTQKLNGSLEEKVERLIATVQSMDSRSQRMEARVESIDSRLASLETKVDERLKEDTRPIWEAVQTQLAELKESQAELRKSQEEMRAELQGFRAETEKGFRTIDRRMERQIGEFERLHAYQRDLEDRVDQIEKRITR